MNTQPAFKRFFFLSILATAGLSTVSVAQAPGKTPDGKIAGGREAEKVVLSAPEKPAPKSQIKRGMRTTLRGQAAFNMYGGSQTNKNSVTFTAAGLGSTAATSTTRNSSHVFALDDSRIEFEALNNMDFMSFLQWRLNVAISADKSAGTPSIVKQAYITLKSKYSTLHLGLYPGVEDFMAFSGNHVAGGTGGVESSFTKFVGPTTGTHHKVDLVGDTTEATKATIVSPRFKGVMVGLSYTPSTAHYGSPTLNTASAPTFVTLAPYSVRNIAAGINYVGFLTPDLKLSLSFTGIKAAAKAETTAASPAGQSLDRKNIQSWALGGIVNYQKFAFAFEYANCGKSNQFANSRAAITPTVDGKVLSPIDYSASQAQAPRWFDLGISYLWKDTKFAVVYLQSWRKTGFADIKAKARVYNASITHQVQPGLSVYIEGFRYIGKNDAALHEGQMLAQSLPTGTSSSAVITNQKATLGVIGIKASF